MNKKELVLKYEGLLSWIYRVLGRNRTKVAKGNVFHINNAFAKGCRFSISGKNNSVEIEPGLTRLTNTSISVYGSDCQVVIGGGGNLVNVHLVIENDNGSIVLKRHVTISGQTEIAVIEGTKVTIGEDCLFSAQINIRTGDSHSILNQETGKRINPSQDVTIGDHVWVGNDVKILKGVKIGEHSIVGTGAILSGGDYPSHSIIGGIGHGKVLKTGIDWCPQRIKIEE